MGDTHRGIKMIQSKKAEFLKELKKLLKTYNVSIGFKVSDSSDTYGLSDERMVVTQSKDTWLTVDGWHLSYKDID